MSADVQTATDPTATEEASRLCGAVVGGVAGAAGGLVFGASMAVTGMLPTVASIVRTDSELAGFGVHMVFAVLIGAAFGLLVVRLRLRVRDMLFWGLAYGALWWFLGPQTLLPLFRGMPVDWGATEAGALLPSLIGHLFYGTTAALVLVLHQHDLRATWQAVPVGAVLRGAAAGIVSATVLVAATLAVEFPSLVGHFAYGAALGGVYYRLEAGLDPWWMTRSDLEASRVAARREQVLSAAPAIWALTTVIAVTLPILLDGA